MSKRDFEQLLNNHSTQQESQEINWENQKDEWLEYIDSFYKTVERWFEPYVAAKNVYYSFYETTLVEDYIGTYTVNKMKIDFAGQSLVMEPIGTLLIGTKGRIDMEGARGRVQFILADKSRSGLSIQRKKSQLVTDKDQSKIEWTWKIVSRDSNRIRFEDFNEENFFDALMEVINV